MRATKLEDKKGFTLIELMIVAAIIGILAVIAIPKFADLIRKSQEGATKGSLGAIKSALSIYYGDMEGLYPSLLVYLTSNSKYLQAMPLAKTPYYHPDSSAEYDCACPPPFGLANDAGGWGYNSAPGVTPDGSVFVNCTHTDTKGTVWTNY